MKRRASEDVGSENPAKVSKDAGNNQASSLARADTVVNKSDAEPTRSRQRKAPAWLSSYVTGGSAKDLAKAASEIPNPSKRSPSSAAKKQGSGEGVHQNEEKTPKKPNEKSTGKTKIMQKMSVNNKLISSKSSSSSSSSSVSTLKPSSPSSSSPKPSSKQDPDKHSKPSFQSSESALGNSENVLEVCEDSHIVTTSTSVDSKNSKLTSSSGKKLSASEVSSAASADSFTNSSKNVGKASALATAVKEETVLMPKKGETPTMLEVVICVSTSGAMQEYLAELQEQVREMVWRLQSLIPTLRIGVFAHTQGGIHDDKRAGGSCSIANIDHNYIRTGGHSGTKWLDLGASFSQICAFVNSLEPEAVIYPDYVQDNLEMALWKLQRCMTWSSCSYRTVVMLGRGRPNSTTFYLQREHWRGWIRSALELGPRQEVPVIDWRLEARLLAQMGIHVFTLQAVSEGSGKEEDEEEEEEEGTKFFRETAATTNGQHFCLTDASRLVDIIVGVCCACYGPDLLQEHRDELRDQNDGVVPPKLKDIFVSLGLHSNRRSLKTIPSLVGDLQAMQNKIKAADLANGRLLSISEEEGGMSSEGEEWSTKTADVQVKEEASANMKGTKKRGRKPKVENQQNKSLAVGKTSDKTDIVKVKVENGVKNGRVEKKSSKPIEKKKVANVLKKLKPVKADSPVPKSENMKAEKSNGLVKAKSLNGKSEGVPKQVKKVGRPRLATKAAALVKKAAALTKPAANTAKANKSRDKKASETVSENNGKSKPATNAQEVKVKAKPGRPPKVKQIPDPKQKQQQKPNDHKTSLLTKKMQSAANKSANVTSVLDKKKAVTKSKAETQGSVVAKSKLPNGKASEKSIKLNKSSTVTSKDKKFIKGTSAAGRNNKLVKESPAAGRNRTVKLKESSSTGKKVGQGARSKGAVTVTRGSLRVRK